MYDSLGFRICWTIQAVVSHLESSRGIMSLVYSDSWMKTALSSLAGDILRAIGGQGYRKLQVTTAILDGPRKLIVGT